MGNFGRQVLVLTMAVTGCATAATPSPSLTVDDFYTKYLAAVCHADATCGGSRFSSEAGCLKSAAFSFADTKALTATAHFDPAQAAACLDSWAGCNDSPHLACDLVFTGTVATGGACSSTSDCVAGGYCDNCACKATAATGEACTKAFDCASHYCVGPMGALKCAIRPPLPKVGESCTSATLAAGETAMGTSDCARGARCDATTKKCGPLAASGGACTSASECQPGLICPIASGATQGVCQAAPALGNACAGASDGGQCGYDDIMCLGAAGQTTCRTIAALGEDCSGGICEIGLGCDATSKKCVVAPAIGQACLPAGECAAGAACDPTTKKCVTATGSKPICP